MTYSVGVLIYDGFDLQDIAAPYHVLAHAASSGKPDSPLFNLYTVARTKELITCYGGAQLLPQHIYPDAEIYDVLLVPGGPGYQDALRVLRLMDWINRASRLAQVIAAVNTGIYLLAASRLLSGKTVAAVPGLTDAYPDVQVVKGDTLVQDGNILSISSYRQGEPLALAVVAELEGSKTADHIKDHLP
ncbi:MAG: DJ-1/PfpI family protein [Candidatus Promineifilaceae bacterium]